MTCPLSFTVAIWNQFQSHLYDSSRISEVLGNVRIQMDIFVFLGRLSLWKVVKRQEEEQCLYYPFYTTPRRHWLFYGVFVLAINTTRTVVYL